MMWHPGGHRYPTLVTGDILSIYIVFVFVFIDHSNYAHDNTLCYANYQHTIQIFGTDFL